jgi:hypothetical protein
LPGWRRYSPRNPQALTGSEGGGNGYPAASCDRRIGRGHSGATSGPRTTRPQRTTPVISGSASSQFTGQNRPSAAGRHHHPALSRTEEPSSRLAGGRLRRPSSHRQRHDRHRGIGLTLTSGAAEHVPAQILLALSRRGRPRLRERVRRTGRERFPSASVWCRETTWLRSLTGQRATQFSCRSHESGPLSKPPV